MAQPLTREDKEQPNQMRELADQAVSLLKSYVLTGSAWSKDRFVALWRANERDDRFYDRVVDGITANPQAFRTLVTAYQRNTGNWPTPSELFDALDRCNAELAKPESQRDQAVLGTWGPELPAEIQRLRAGQSAPIRVPSTIDDDSINAFVRMLGIPATEAGTGKEARLRAVINAVQVTFDLHEPTDSRELSQALLHAYTLLGSEDRRRFLEWIRGMERPQRLVLSSAVMSASKAHQIRLPHEFVREEFEKWKAASAARQQKLSEMEAELRTYPASIRDGNTQAMAREFETDPSDLGLEKIERRLEYVGKRAAFLRARGQEGDRAETDRLLSETSALESWLSRLGIRAENAKHGTERLRAGLVMLQQQYYTMTPERPAVAEYLASVSANQPLSTIYRRYVSALDRRTARIFDSIPADSPDYATAIRQRIGTRMSSDRVRRGAAQWASDYYPLLATVGAITQNPAIAQMYNRIANLDPLLATAFFDYLEAASEGGLTSVELKKLVVVSVAELYAVNPLLAIKYFSAIRNLAYVCQDNSEAYRNALVLIAARIDAMTAPITSTVTPNQILPLNVRSIINNIERSLEDIGRIQRSSVAQYDRLSLLDDRVTVQPYAPHSIEQKPPGYAPRLLVNQTTTGPLLPPYPFPPYIGTTTPTTLFSSGGVFTSPPTYGGSLTLPTFNPMMVFSGATAVGTSLKFYVDPEHPVVSISKYLPGAEISGLSMTRLLNEINRAFIPTQMPEYSKQILSGGGAAGISGQMADGWQVMGGGLGTLITPTGGASIGGSAGAGAQFAGMSAVAVPVGIPVLGGSGASQKVTGIDSMVGGFSRLDDGTSHLLIQALQTMWDPKNPSQMLLTVNRDQLADGTKYMTARYFFIDRSGQIFELKGGQNDLVQILNFAAGYGNQQLETPTTYAWNTEPTVSRGGGVLAVDIGKTPILAHAQAVPFFLPEGTPQPFLLQWTPSLATTIQSGANAATIPQISFPGQYMRIQDTLDPTKQDQYILQDVDFMIRRIERQDAWELRLGGGYGHTPFGPTGRGGFLLRFQTPKSHTGGGAFYEAGATNFYAIALLQQSSDLAAYIASLHRIGGTIYADRQTENKVLVGALAHVVEQLRVDPAAGVIPDATFYRFVGLIKGLRSAARLDVGRYSALDQMLLDYNEMGRQIGNDPTQAQTLMNNFQAQYAATIQQVFDNYYLGIQINRNLSVEASILAREDGTGWTSQVPDNVTSRILFTWKTGFWRAFAMMPLMQAVPPAVGTTAPVMSSSGSVIPGASTIPTVPGSASAPPGVTLTANGIIGTGAGIDLLEGFFMQRAAMDVGILVAGYESNLAPTAAPVITDPTQIGTPSGIRMNWIRTGHFVQGAVRAFSNVLEDSTQYRRLITEFESHRERIGDGAFSDLPEPVRTAIADGLDQATFPRELIGRIRRGEDSRLTQTQQQLVEESFWRNWFYQRKLHLQQRFNGHVRTYLAASGYFYSDRTYWDIGTFIESVDHFKLYMIGTRRETYGGFAGADVTIGKVRAGILGGGTQTGFGASASIMYEAKSRPVPVQIGLGGFAHSTEIPAYAAPFYTQQLLTGTPEFGAMFFFTIGSGAGVPYLQNQQAFQPQLPR